MIRKAADIKLNVQPVFFGFNHLYFYEGPCRFGQGDTLQPEYEVMAMPQMAKDFYAQVDACMDKTQVNVLEPIYVQRTDDWEVKEAVFEELSKDIAKVDLYILSVGIGRDELAVEFAQRFRKPIAMIPDGCCDTPTITAPVRAMGVECYGFISWDELGKFMNVLRVRKVLANTNMMCVVRTNSTISHSSVDSFSSLDKVTNTLGVKFRYVNMHELLDQMTPATPEGNHTTPGRKTWDITEAEIAKAGEMADELIANADYVDIDREYLVNSLKAYLTVQKHLDQWDCNAFTAPCPDLCSTRRFNQQKFTFCLTHSLNNEQGIPSCCEYDIDGVVSMMVLTSISGKEAYLGNTNVLSLEADGKIRPMRRLFEEDLAELDDLSNLVHTCHSIPGRYFKGIGGEKAKYGINHFAYEQGFGAVMRYDFKADKGTPITMCRFSPDCSKLFVAKGTIVGGGGYELSNCNNYVLFRVPDLHKFFDGQCVVGNHIPLVYGDYYDQLVKLGKVLGLEVIEG